MAMNEDLWPKELGLGIVPTPLSILRAQASLLAEKTQGVLEGVVETWSSGNDIYHRFHVVVPALDKYRYELFKIHHSLTLYPVVVDEVPAPAPPTTQVAGYSYILKDLNVTAPNWVGPLGEKVSVPGLPHEPLAVLRDEAEFRAWLRDTLASEQTQRIISSLYGQAAAA